MAARDEIIAYLDELLDAPAFDDYGPNGLQVVGAAKVETVATGVSAHLELFRRAAAEDAQMVLTHHGILWTSSPCRSTPRSARGSRRCSRPTCRWPPTTSRSTPTRR